MSTTWTAVKGIDVELADIAALPRERLERMQAAGEQIQECYRVLKKGDINIVSELLKGQGTFYEFDHYPDGDAFDRDTGSQYYYHSHRGMPGEHGHFHTFVRTAGIGGGITPVPYDGDQEWPTGDDAVSHIIALSMDRYGFPIGFFTTNRWVTDEGWYAAADVARMTEKFEIDHAFPSWPTNQWLGAMLRLYLPDIVHLLEHRDRIVANWAETHPDKDVYEDRDLDITGRLRIHVKARIEALREALA